MDTLPLVIIVEDESLIRECIVKALAAAQYRSVTMQDGEDANQLLSTLNERCIFLVDLLMPKMDGWELLERIREYSVSKKLNHKVIVVSGSANAQEIAHQAEVRFLPKPFSEKELLTLLAQVTEIMAREH